MSARIRDWWREFPLGEAATLAFWNLALVAFLGGAIWIGKGFLENTPTRECAEIYRVTDPQLNAILFLDDLESEGLFDPEQDVIQDFAWVYEGGELRFMVALNSGVYSGVACYTEGEASFTDLQLR
jgi:hypothetical protein